MRAQTGEGFRWLRSKGRLASFAPDLFPNVRSSQHPILEGRCQGKRRAGAGETLAARDTAQVPPEEPGPLTLAKGNPSTGAPAGLANVGLASAMQD